MSNIYNKEGWRYYNHAVIATTAPHEKPDLRPLEDGSIWSVTSSDGNKPMLVRYTTDFDCGEETGFWFIVKDGPFVMADLSKKYQKNILKALERCEVRRIDPVAEIDGIFDVLVAATSRYECADYECSKERTLYGVKVDGFDYWGAYDKATGKMAGWMSCSNNGEWTETISAKYHPDMSYTRPSDAIHYAVLNHYLNELGQKYVCSGSRSVNHKTNAQEYKVHNWKFRRAYCNLHIIYKKEFGIVIKLIYPFRNLLMKLDKINVFHQINSLLKMEEIARECKKTRQR